MDCHHHYANTTYVTLNLRDRSLYYWVTHIVFWCYMPSLSWGGGVTWRLGDRGGGRLGDTGRWWGAVAGGCRIYPLHVWGGAQCPTSVIAWHVLMSSVKRPPLSQETAPRRSAIGSLVGHCLRCWPTNKPALAHCMLFIPWSQEITRRMPLNPHPGESKRGRAKRQDGPLLPEMQTPMVIYRPNVMNV